MTDTPEEPRGNPHEFHPTAGRHNCPSCDRHWAWDDGYTAGLEAGRRDEAAKERARITAMLRERASRLSDMFAAEIIEAADLIERGSGVPEGETA